MLFETSYFMPSQTASIKHHEKGSVFIGICTSVENEQDAKLKIEKTRSKYSDATHVCWAYILLGQSSNPRFSDDGEPANTAGRPILREMQRKQLQQTLVLVVRYYGGINLGIRGLINHYGLAAKNAIEKANISELPILEKIMLNVPYGLEPQCFEIIKQHSLLYEIKTQETGQTFTIWIPKVQVEIMKEKFISIID